MATPNIPNSVSLINGTRETAMVSPMSYSNNVCVYPIPAAAAAELGQDAVTA